MLFFQLEFLSFFGILLGLMALSSKVEYRKVLLLAASYYFYAFFDYRFLSLVAISTLTDFCAGRALSRSDDHLKRKLLLILSLVVNLSILGFFKYYNFFIDSFLTLFNIAGGSRYMIGLALPLGISYYTFQTLTYTIDVYNKKMDAHNSILDYALFVGFFPPLLSGPIMRASRVLPQIEAGTRFSIDNIAQGIRLFVIGLFLKIFMADRIGMFVDVVFENPGLFNSKTVWLAVLGFSLQLYFDFAGYSNMAIGISRILGYDVGKNFNFPYLAGSIADFWKRWHISLSSWIRDYLYIPLGGSRKGTARTIANLIFVMLLCGLWHGPTWTFVLWGGGYHGVAMAVHRMWSKSGMRLPAPMGWVLTMIVVMVGWVFFRSSDSNHALTILRQMFYPAPGVDWMFPFVIFALAATVLVHMIELYERLDIHRLPIRKWYTPAILMSMMWLVVIFHPKGFKPFIYLNF